MIKNMAEKQLKNIKIVDKIFLFMILPFEAESD